MKRKEAEQRFREASAFAAAGRHAEALPLVNAIAEFFPNSPELAYLRVKCLTALGRTQEALIAREVLNTRLEEGREDKEAIRTLLSPKQAQQLEALLDSQTRRSEALGA